MPLVHDIILKCKLWRASKYVPSTPIYYALIMYSWMGFRFLFFRAHRQFVG